MASEAFKDGETLAKLQSFVPILVDGDVDKDATKKFGVRGYPNTTFVDKKGKVLGEVGGYVPTDQFLRKVNSALKKNGKIKLTKKYKTLVASADKIKKSMVKKRYADALREISKLEKVGHKGPQLSDAQETKAKIQEIGKERFASASALEEKEPKKSKVQFQKIARDFKGLEVSKRAKAKVKEIAARLKKK